MGGPIVRSYGVPNWDEIFGKKEASDSAGQTGKANAKTAAARGKTAGKKAKATPKARAASKKKAT